MTDTAVLLERHEYLKGLAADVAAEMAAIKSDLAESLGIGEHLVAGATVKVRQPNRSFNLERGYTFLTPEQQALSVSPDAKKVKGFLSPVLLDAAMDAGTGNPIVSIS